MNRQRVRTFVQDWVMPGLLGLALAAVAIAGSEIGGTVGWVLIGLVAIAVFGTVVWAFQGLYLEPWDEDIDPTDSD